MINELLVRTDLDVKKREDVIIELTKLAYEYDYIESAENFMSAVMEREQEFPTSFGFEVAIPHGITNTVKKPFVAFCRSKEPFVWDSEDCKEVRIIFMIGVPADSAETLHLAILSRLSRKLLDENIRNQFKTENADYIYHILKEIEIEVFKEREEK